MGQPERPNITGNPDHAQSRRKELMYAPHAVDALRGTVVKTIKDGSAISVVVDGSGQFGLTDLADNKKWAGIFHHSVLTGRYASHISQIMQGAGYDTDPQRIVNAMVFSHAGRRQSEDARDYPDALDTVAGEGTAQERSRVTNETLGLRIIKDKVPQDEFDLISALAHDNEEFVTPDGIREGLDYRLSIYIDHRTTNKYMPLNERLGDFLVANFFDGGNVEPDKRTEIHQTMQDIIDKRKDDFANGVPFETSLEYAQELAGELGANHTSSRLKNRSHLLTLLLQDAETEAMLERAGINPDAIDDILVPIPQWETDLRKDYVKAAKNEIVDKLESLHEQIELDPLEADTFWDIIDREFPTEGPLGWWGQAAREIYVESIS